MVRCLSLIFWLSCIVYGAANSIFAKTDYVSGTVTLNFIESCFPFLIYSTQAVALTQTVARDVSMFN